MTHYFNSIFS